MNLHRAFPVRLAVAALSLALAGTSVAGTRSLVVTPLDAPGNQICIANISDDVAIVNPSSADEAVALVLILPKGADADRISVSPTQDWKVDKREFRPTSRALIFSVSPARPMTVQGQSIAACFELVGIKFEELGPIGLATSVRAEPESAPPVRR